MQKYAKKKKCKISKKSNRPAKNAKRPKMQKKMQNIYVFAYLALPCISQ